MKFPSGPLKCFMKTIGILGGVGHVATEDLYRSFEPKVI